MILKNPISTDIKNEYFVRCYVGDKNICINNTDDFLTLIDMISCGSMDDFYIDLTFNTIMGSKNFASVVAGLKSCYNKNGSVDIFTSGRNIANCTTFLTKKVDNVNVFVDDYEIQSILKFMDVDQIKFNCHLSENYLLNLDNNTFDYVCGQDNFKFNRSDIISKRTLIKTFWDTRLNGVHNIKSFSDEEKVMLVLDYINSNIRYTNHKGRVNSGSDNCKSDPVEVLKNKEGNSKGLSLLACFLLNNYLARVDCHEVEGYHRTLNTNISWIVTKINGNKYGHCLVMPKRFKQLSKYGYLDGKMTLEPMQFSRIEYISTVDGYSEMSDPDCLYLSYSLNDKISLTKQDDKGVAYVKSKKNVSN